MNGTTVLQYEGRVVDFREALRRFREETPSAGTVVGDRLHRRRLARRLREAQIASIRAQILGSRPGGDAA